MEVLSACGLGPQVLGVGQLSSPRCPESMSELWGRDKSQNSFLWF